MTGQAPTRHAPQARSALGQANLARGLGPDGAPIPAYHTFSVEVRSAHAGAAVARLPTAPQLAPAGGGLLPGALAIIADTCCGCAVASALPAGKAPLTAQLRVEYVRPAPTRLRWIEGRAEADVVDDGGGLARGEIVDDSGQLLGVTSLRILNATSRPGREGSRPKLHAAPGTTDGTPGIAVPGVLGLAGRSASPGRVEWTLHPPPAIANSYGMVHGGVLGLLAHEVASDALRSLLGDGEELIPLDLVLNFYRGVPADGGAITATAEVTHRGRRFVVAEGDVLTADGRLALRLSAGAELRAT